MSTADDAAVARALRSFAAAMLGLAAHELNNRLAVMRETVGLMDDLARAGKSGAAGTARAHASLVKQIGRALNIVRTLSGLGGALGANGTPAGGFDAGAAIGELLGLCERWSRQHSLRIEREVAGDLPRAGGDPALFLCLAHRLLVGCAANLRPGGSIVLRARRDGDGIRLSLSPGGARSEGAAAPEDADDGINRELARRLGGQLEFEGGGAPAFKLATFR